ncbi:SGNH/GDSL hydrolase family protein [Sphingomonas cannabina]|uniref:SGNH/GDSL hydrolase family protein n=1 Tax=Sphingomonas cannabina TaxID=2899123 RepID=UPI001F402E01|nr:SGNH/GDSL hydrolase family protein [Sphingomonas cannabina]UIJ43686.1 SGNH/GDSL hydrolase family protein [Sphingomonas cannabina]
MTVRFAFLLPASAALLSLQAAAPAQTAAATCPADGKWSREADFGWLCRYRADNQALSAARTKVRIVFMGDSITEGWIRTDPGFFRSDRVDRGISGQTTPQMSLRFAQDVVALKPAVVHIMAGTNDIAGNTGPMTQADTEREIRKMVRQARAAGIRVVIGSVLPAGAFRWRPGIQPAQRIIALNRWLRSYARANGLVYADYHSAMAAPDGSMKPGLAADGVHPNADGYAIMRPIAEAAIAKALKR